jgi:histone deacetylase 1/2
MHKMKALADTMAVAGAPISDDELVDYIITGLGKAYNSIAGNLTMNNRSVPYSEFYSTVLSFESLQAAQAQEDVDFISSANAAARPGFYNNPSRPRSSDFAPVQYSGGSSGGSNAYSQQGQGRSYNGGNYQGGNDRQQSQSGGYGGGNERQHNGGNGGGGRKKRQRPRCQICNYWGHQAYQCKNRFNPDFRADNNSNQRSGNGVTTSHNPPHWLMDSGASDHFTNDLERLHIHERYNGKDNVQVANGIGLSISHIGHSTLAGSSLHLKNILHVPDISQHLLSVYRLVCDNYVFVEFHRDFFCVKDKATRRILLLGRSQDGLYPIPYTRASPSSRRHASSSVKVSSSRWHQRLGHPSNKVVQSLVQHHSLPCLPSDNLVCDACQRAKSHQLSYTASERVSTMPLELIHSDVWGPAISSSGGYKYYVSFIDDYSRFCWIYLLNINLMSNKFSTTFRPMLSAS